MNENGLTHEARIRALELVVASRIPGNPGEVSLKEHIEARLAALEQATRVASDSMEHRLDGMNEFRSTLKDQAAKFVTRDEVNLQISVNSEAIDNLQSVQDRQAGAASAQSVYVAYAFSLVGIILGVLGFLVK